MAKIQNIKIGDTSYQIKDGSAVQSGSALPAASADYAGKLFNQTSDGKLYICTKTSENQYVWTEYLSLFNAVLLNESNVGNLNLTGNLTVSGNISQHGEAYITEAEKVESKDDYIAMRHGNTSALGDSEYSGLEIENYDGGNNNLRLVVDNKGVARVGDIGDEQPLLTRDEANTLSSGSILLWDNTREKATSKINEVEYIALPPLRNSDVGASSYNNREFFEKMIKYIVSRYSTGSGKRVFIAVCNPGLSGIVQMHFERVSDYLNGLPDTCSGMYNSFMETESIERFGTFGGVFWYEKLPKIRIGTTTEYNNTSISDNTLFFING